MASFEARSATRVDLAGGTLDLWPLSALVPKASTVNSSISCYTEVLFNQGSSLKISVESPDFKEDFSFLELVDFLNAEDSKLSLLQEAFAVMKDPMKGVGHWMIKSESPAGSGLGGSSSLLISILKVMFQIEGVIYTEKSIIESAKNVESRVLKTPAGIQDYFSPVEEGMNFITYLESGFERTDMSESLSFWRDCISIVDSQIKHHSGMNNWDILKKYIDQDDKVVEALHSIAQISLKTKRTLDSKDLKNLASCFADELEARTQVSDSYINEELKSFLDKLKKIEGVMALKVCGAGGGGCVLVLHKSEDKDSVQSALRSESIALLPFELTGA